MPFWFLPEIFIAVMGASSIGGEVATWCHDHPGNPGCVKRSAFDIDSGPKFELFPRQATGACGVPQYNFDLCHDQLQGVTVISSIPGKGQAQFDKVPPACMDLVTVLSGSCTSNSPRPTPCGSACVVYSGLTDDDFARISKALNG
ncbi:hypothetical protein F5Y06DRAFT_293509 [Hypoxylon sp. FL0890]|nr:hypothetical protein F5Y06DRAFT_293509 [Hypoxylon sp. FL0890]